MPLSLIALLGFLVRERMVCVLVMQSCLTLQRLQAGSVHPPGIQTVVIRDRSDSSAICHLPELMLLRLLIFRLLVGALHALLTNTCNL
jgi:hypothetical protein